MATLTILCVTRAEPCALPFLEDMAGVAYHLDARLLIAADGPEAYKRLDDLYEHITLVRSAGYLESVLDQAIARCPNGHILRLDDDERCDDLMVDWLARGEYETADHWAFPRYNLWPDEHSFITSLGLYPDPQTRLSVKGKAGGRHQIHVGSPYGTGVIAPVHIEHHKFLVRSLEERRRILAGYERLLPGADRWRQFSCPEDMPADLIIVESRLEEAA